MTDKQFTLADIDWAANECLRQRTGPIEVVHLCRALDYLRCMVNITGEPIVKPTLDLVVTLGKLIEPQQNARGIRTLPIQIKGFTNHPVDLPHRVEHLGSHYFNTPDMTADEWYFRFEVIHPFNDGNGRVGSLIWNMLNFSLDDLRVPPQFSALYERYHDS